MSNIKYKILIVDDDKFLLEMYKLKFDKNGHEVTMVTIAADALSKLKDGLVPDIILVDIVLPGMDGLQLLEVIRKDKICPNAIIVMLTNQGGKEEIEKAKSLKVDGYLVKAALVPSEVVEKVLKIVEKNKK
ncbi:MAG: response regulator [Candidatus Taylorbacteria bacterium]|nr:response regulator [Candidatus Taylorbacteria bacterium]